mmetsp:Transcript_24282/g.61813  ORF Transcript_24282/g.61813 Transcript_24282/m.61813 type:complete len:282 (-) Transcript_24282:1671-2516(-)
MEQMPQDLGSHLSIDAGCKQLLDVAGLHEHLIGDGLDKDQLGVAGGQGSEHRQDCHKTHHVHRQLPGAKKLLHDLVGLLGGLEIGQHACKLETDHAIFAHNPPPLLLGHHLGEAAGLGPAVGDSAECKLLEVAVHGPAAALRHSKQRTQHTTVMRMTEVQHVSISGIDRIEPQHMGRHRLLPHAHQIHLHDLALPPACQAQQAHSAQAAVRVVREVQLLQRWVEMSDSLQDMIRLVADVALDQPKFLDGRVPGEAFQQKQQGRKPACSVLAALHKSWVRIV